MSKRGAVGDGGIRKKTVMRGGVSYSYYEARITTGKDPGTGKQIQRSISGKTQKEVRERLTEVRKALKDSAYTAPAKMTLSQWLDRWTANYLVNAKPRTRDCYTSNIDTHIKPALGAVQLDTLNSDMVQEFISSMGRTLSAKTVRNVHGVLHAALEKAKNAKLIAYNPADGLTLPKMQDRDIHPLSETEQAAFLKAISGQRFEAVYLVGMFTGMREGELLGLSWDDINFKGKTITVTKQLQRIRKHDGSEASDNHFMFISPKSGKTREIVAAAYVMDILKHQKVRQAEMQLKAGPLWDNPHKLVFTNDVGGNLSPQTVYLDFKRIVEAIGRPDARLHDLRHTFATVSLAEGVDLKTLQETLGHWSPAFTLSTYTHSTEQMKKDAADKMDERIKQLIG
jgi:integrase